MYAKMWKFERVLPSLTVAFGIITLGAGFVTNYAGLVSTRIVLGLFEGCLFPGLALVRTLHVQSALQAVDIAFTVHSELVRSPGYKPSLRQSSSL